jgi:hypothetical protein
VKLLVIVGVVAVALLAGWRLMAGRVDRTNPSAVATAFVAAIKSENTKKASSYWLPDGAEAWQVNAEKTMSQMQSGTSTRFFEGLPAHPIFVSSHNPKSPANEQTLTADGATVDLRNVDGKWYVCKGPL